MKRIIKNKLSKINFKNINIFVGISLIITGFMYSCQSDDEFDYIEKGLPYLSLSAYFSGFDIEKTSDSDWHVFHLAHQRMDIREKNGIFYTKWKSGNQINVSEELFEFFINVINNTNRVNEENRNITSSFPRLKNDDEGDKNKENNSTPNDCVARAIVDILKALGKSNVSFEEVDAWIRSKYGNNGVSSSKFDEAVSHFLKGSETSLPSSYIASSGTRYLVVERPGGSGDGHAGVLVGVSGSSVIYQDSQNNGNVRSCSTSDIAKVYKATGAQ